jgi:hypothetical protein
MVDAELPPLGEKIDAIHISPPKNNIAMFNGIKRNAPPSL